MGTSSSGTAEVVGGGANGGSVSVSASPAVPKVPGTPSWLTGEFYAAITPAVVAVIGAFTGAHVVPGAVERELVAFGTVAVMVYAVARTALKATHVHAAAKIATAEAMSAAAVARSSDVAGKINLDAVAAHAARHAVSPAAIADELDRRFVLRHRQPSRRKQ